LVYGAIRHSQWRTGQHDRAEARPRLGGPAWPGGVSSSIIHLLPLGSYLGDLDDSCALSDPAAQEMMGRWLYLLLLEKPVNGVNTRAWWAIAQFLQLNWYYATAPPAIHVEETFEAGSQETGDREKLGRNDARFRKPLAHPTSCPLHIPQANSTESVHKIEGRSRVRSSHNFGWNWLECCGVWWR